MASSLPTKLIVGEPGVLPKTLDRVPIQTPSRFTTADKTGTPITSPKTVSSTEIDLLVPDNAITFVVTAVGGDLRVAAADSGTATSYTVVLENTTQAFPCAGMTGIYLLRNAAADITTYFSFEIVG